VETVTVTSSLVGGSTDVAVTSASQLRNRTSGKQGARWRERHETGHWYTAGC
jgi:hypothetical protein